jgi:hypothetical protein
MNDDEFIRGGQGRTATELRWEANLVAICMVVAFFIVLSATFLSGCGLSKFNGM